MRPSPAYRFWVLVLILATLLPSSTQTVRASSHTTQSASSSFADLPLQTDEPLEVQVDDSIDLTSHPANARFTLHFNQVMDINSTENPVLIYPYTDGKTTWDTGRTSLHFSPDPPLETGGSYIFFLDSRLRSASGKSFEQIQLWEVQVQTGPAVIARQPAATELDTRHPQIELTFDRPMDQASVEEALSVLPDVSLGFSWKGETLLIEAEQPLDPGNRYAFTLAANAKDAQGVSMGNDYRWEHWLAPFEIQSSGPTYNTAQVWLDFSHAIDQKKSGLPFTVQPVLTGVWNWESDRRAKFVYESELPYGKTYTIKVISPLYDTNGEALPIPETRLTFAAPPPIDGYFPESEIEVPRETEIRIDFNVEMDLDSVQDAFQIEPATPGDFEWVENSLIFHPSQPLLSYENYTVSLAPTARDAQRRLILTEPFQWTFQTSYYILDESRFSDYGPNVQVVDAEGRRVVQFLPDTGGDIQFQLIPFGLSEFATLYAKDYRYEDYDSARTIDTGDEQPLFTWQESFEEGGIAELTIPADVPPGLYVLKMAKDGLTKDALFVILTRNSLVVKREGSDLFIWASDINGESQSGIEIRLYSDRGEKIRTGSTDENGIYRTTIPDGYEALFIAGRAMDGDTTLAGIGANWNSSGSWWWWGSEIGEEGSNILAYIYTDRPIYQPGQIVYFKAILRADRDVKYSLPPVGTPVLARLIDPRDNVVETVELTSNTYGTINGEFKLAEGAMLGDYSIEVFFDGENTRQILKVQEYRKPDMVVSVQTDAEKYVVGDPINVDVDVMYLFGQPVSNANLTIKTYYLIRDYRYWWAEESSEVSYQWFEAYDRQPQTGRTDANGHYSFSLDARMGDEYQCFYSWRNSLQECAWGLEVSVDDGSHQVVSSSVIYRIYNSAEKLTLDSGGYLQQPAVPFTVHAKAMTLEDEVVAGKDLKLDIRRWDWESDTYYDMLSIPLVTDEVGQASHEIVLDQPGSYELVLSGSDRRGNEMKTTRWLYVYTSGETWASRYDDQVSITAVQDSYKPYQTGRFLIESSFSGPALLTFERGSVIHYKPIELTAPLTVVEAEIIPEYAPNVYVTVNAWQLQDSNIEQVEYWGTSLPDSRLRVDEVEIQVEATTKMLQVTITPDQQIYAPRQEATFTIQVTNWQGQPVQTELSFALIDEAIFSLSAELSKPIFHAFYGRRQHTVRTYDSMAATREMWTGRGGGGGGGELTANPRAEFPDTAAWFPVIETDQRGLATVTVTLPDTLTTWRATVKAVGGSTQVGEARAQIITQQEVIVRPLLPRVMTAGDTITLAALVHNYGATSREMEVSMQGELLGLQTAPTQTIEIASGEAVLVNWEANPSQAGEVQVTVIARASSAADPAMDAVRLPLTIQPLSVPDVYSLVGDFQGDFSTPLVWLENALPISQVEVAVSRSIAGSLLDGLSYLTGYPYGCVEQTMSRALPNATVARALTQITSESVSLPADLPEMINAGLQKLYGMQHSDGGWGWWFDDDTHDYQTAWVVFGLALTAQAGYEVDPGVIERGADWLVMHLDEMDLRTRAYALYSLGIAGYGDLAATQALADQVFKLDPFSQAALALALHEMGTDDQALEILGTLAQSAQQMNGWVYWPQPNEDGHYYEKTMSSTTRSTAMVLDAYAHLDPENELVGGMVRYLMSQRRSYGWGSTNETSFAILALTDHLLTLETQAEQTPYAILLNGEILSQGTLGAGQISTNLSIPNEAISPGTNLVEISGDPAVRLYYSITSRMYLPQAEISPKGVVSVSREYVNPQTGGSALNSVVAGQLVRVNLSVTLENETSYLIIEDRLPGGFEALNENLNTSSHAGNFDPYCGGDSYECTFYHWQEYGYNNKEIHTDRVSFFITEAAPGTLTISYLARATHAGSFVAMPTEVSAMYDETIWGRSASEVLIVEP